MREGLDWDGIRAYAARGRRLTDKDWHDIVYKAVRGGTKGWSKGVQVAAVPSLDVILNLILHCLNFRDDRFLPQPFQFIIYCHPVIRRYVVSVTDSNPVINTA
jgi:hypothetical protein